MVDKIQLSNTIENLPNILTNYQISSQELL